MHPVHPVQEMFLSYALYRESVTSFSRASSQISLWP